MTTSMAISGQKDSRGQRRDQLTCMKVIRLFMPRQSSENAARLPGLSFILYSSLMSPVNTKHTVLTCTAHLCPQSTTQSTQSSPVQLTYVPCQQNKAHSPHQYSSLMSPVNNTKHTVFTSTAHLCPLQLTYVSCQQHKAHSLHQYSSLMSPNTKHTVLTSTAHLCPQSTTQSTQSSPVQLTYVSCQQNKGHSPHQYSSLMSPVNNTEHTVLIHTACLSPDNNTMQT